MLGHSSGRFLKKFHPIFITYPEFLFVSTIPLGNKLFVKPTIKLLRCLHIPELLGVSNCY